MPLGQPAVLPIQERFAQYGIDFAQEASVFAADFAMPYAFAPKTSGWYPVPDARNWLHAEDATWSREQGATRVVSQYDKDTFLAKPYGLEEIVSDLDANDWPGGPADMGRETMSSVGQRVLVAREVRIEAKIDAATFGTTAVTGTGIWDSTAANPRLDVKKANTAIRKKIGRPGNSIILPLAVADVITGSQAAGTAGAAVLDAIKYTGAGGLQEITETLLAQYWRLARVKFAEAIQQDTTKPVTRAVVVGLPEAGVAIWDQKEAYVFFNGTPGSRLPNFASSFGPDLYTPDDYYDPKPKGRVYRVVQVLDEKIVCNAAMNVLTTVIT